MQLPEQLTKDTNLVSSRLVSSQHEEVTSLTDVPMQDIQE